MIVKRLKCCDGVHVKKAIVCVEDLSAIVSIHWTGTVVLLIVLYQEDLTVSNGSGRSLSEKILGDIILPFLVE